MIKIFNSFIFFHRLSWKNDLRIIQSGVEREVVPRDNLINVDRGSPLQSFARAVKRKGFQPMTKLDISFVDIEEQTEGSVDDGGPCREFFRLLLHYISQCDLLEGPDCSKNLRLSSKGNMHNRVVISVQFCSVFDHVSRHFLPR